MNSMIRELDVSPTGEVGSEGSPSRRLQAIVLIDE